MYDELFSLRPVFTMIGVVLFTILKQCSSKSTHAKQWCEQGVW